MISTELNRSETAMNVTPPSISVVIPAYNAGPYINAAIDSVLGQTLPPLEIIVIDDGSTDDTCEMINIFGGLVKYVFQENQGISGARNTGIRLACGEWIALLDADDVWHRQKLEIQSAILESHPTIGLLATELYTMDIDGVPLSEPPPARITSFGLETISLLQLIEQSRFGANTVIFKKTLSESLGGFSTQIRASEDMLMWWMIAAQKQILKIDAKLVGYRIHSSSVSFQYQLMANNKKKAARLAFESIIPLKNSFRLRCTARERLFFEASVELESDRQKLFSLTHSLLALVNALLSRDSSGKIKKIWRIMKRMIFLLFVKNFKQSRVTCKRILSR